MQRSAPLESPASHGPPPIDVPLKLWIARLANGLSPAALAQAPMDWWLHLLVSPAKQAQLAASGLHKAQAWAHYLLRAAQGPCENCVTPAPQDKRFNRPEWQQLPFNDAVADMESVLVAGSHTVQADFRRYVEKHRPTLTQRISGWETVDHPTSAQLVGLARFRQHQAASGLATRH